MTRENPTPFKRIRSYVPGFLSLLLLFPMGLYQLDQYGAFERLYVLEVTWHDPRIKSQYQVEFPPKRDYQTILLTGVKARDNIKLDFVQLAIREMLENYDTVNAFRIHFADTARYESFIRALDICNKEERLLFAPHKNDLWIWNGVKNVAESKMLSWRCGTFSYVLSKKHPDDMFAFPLQCGYHKRFWPVLLLLILLAVLSLKKYP